MKKTLGQPQKSMRYGVIKAARLTPVQQQQVRRQEESNPNRLDGTM
jgi:hypothetical protein